MSYEKGDRDRADPCKIYVGGNPEMEEDELRGLFAKHGTVEKVWIARSPPGFAFVWLTDERDVADAIKALDGAELGRHKVTVAVASGPRERRPPPRDRYDDRYDRYDDRRDRYDDRRPPRRPKGPGGFRVKITNLAPGTDWRDLKDAFRRSGDVPYADARGSEGIVEFNSEEDRLRCLKDFDGTEFRGQRIGVEMTEGSTAEFFGRTHEKYPDTYPPPRRRHESDYDRQYRRSRSPPRRDDYDRRDRSPPRRDRRYDDYDDRRQRRLRPPGRLRPPQPLLRRPPRAARPLALAARPLRRPPLSILVTPAGPRRERRLLSSLSGV